MLTQFLRFASSIVLIWLEYSSKVNSAHLKCELCLLSQQISLSCSRCQQRHTPRAFCLNLGFFAFQFAVHARVQREEGRKKSDEEEGKEQREQLNSHSHGADCCPRWAWPCWHHDASHRYVVHYRRQVSSFLHWFLTLCHPVVFSYCSSLPPSSPLPSYLFTFFSLSPLSLSLSLSLKVTWSAVIVQDACFRAAADFFKKSALIPKTMPVSGLPVAAEITLDALLQKNVVSSWKITGDRNNSTVFILRLTAQSSDINSQPLSLCTVHYRKKWRGEDSSNEAPTTPNE